MKTNSRAAMYPTPNCKTFSATISIAKDVFATGSGKLHPPENAATAATGCGQANEAGPGQMSRVGSQPRPVQVRMP